VPGNRFFGEPRPGDTFACPHAKVSLLGAVLQSWWILPLLGRPTCKGNQHHIQPRSRSPKNHTASICFASWGGAGRRHGSLVEVVDEVNPFSSTPTMRLLVSPRPSRV